MVAEHHRRFADMDLSETFGMQTQGNALLAMGCGFLAQGSVFIGGYAAPMVVSMPLLASCAYIVRRWPENKGSGRTSVINVLPKALAGMNLVVARIGAMQCLFEGAMHIFVFLWTPCLQRGGTTVPHGFIFAGFMACMMLGGMVYRSASLHRPNLGVVFFIGAVSLLLSCCTASFHVNLAAFCSFEFCVGCYFPQIALLRSVNLQEETRNATITLLRVPLNFIVVGTLYWGRSWPPETTLLAAALALAFGGAIFFSLPKDVTAVALCAKAKKTA